MGSVHGGLVPGKEGIRERVRLRGIMPGMEARPPKLRAVCITSQSLAPAAEDAGWSMDCEVCGEEVLVEGLGEHCREAGDPLHLALQVMDT